jgi:hypothetical protein
MAASALGWTAALLAVLTAYVRALGGALGLRQSFAGPMAKPQRMLTMVAAVLLSIPETLVAGYAGRALVAALAVIATGSAVTAIRRAGAIHEELLRR